MNKIILAAFLALPCCTTVPKAPAGYCSETRADIENMVPAKSLRESCVLSRTYNDDGLPYELCLQYQMSCDEGFEF